MPAPPLFEEIALRYDNEERTKGTLTLRFKEFRGEIVIVEMPVDVTVIPKEDYYKGGDTHAQEKDTKTD